MQLSRVKLAWRQARPLCFPVPLKPCRQQPRLALSPGLVSNSNLHTAQLHPQGDINDTMAKSKTQTDPKLTPKWQSVSWQKKDQQFASIPSQWRLPQSPPASVTNYLNIPRECGLLTEKEVDITEHYDATGLAQAIRERTFTCVDVTTAFCKVRVYYCFSKTHR
jgi:hypothetical protein